MDKKLVGKVIHYYDKIGVAIIKLSKNINLGDRLKFMKNDNVFEETLESMQVEHVPITKAKSGDEVGIKVSQETKIGTQVYLA